MSKLQRCGVACLSLSVDFRLVDQHVEVALELKERGRGHEDEAVEHSTNCGATQDAMGDAQV